jgi:hypothetical protein
MCPVDAACARRLLKLRHAGPLVIARRVRRAHGTVRLLRLRRCATQSLWTGLQVGYTFQPGAGSRSQQMLIDSGRVARWYGSSSTADANSAVNAASPALQFQLATPATTRQLIDALYVWYDPVELAKSGLGTGSYVYSQYWPIKGKKAGINFWNYNTVFMYRASGLNGYPTIYSQNSYYNFGISGMQTGTSASTGMTITFVAKYNGGSQSGAPMLWAWDYGPNWVLGGYQNYLSFCSPYPCPLAAGRCTRRRR